MERKRINSSGLRSAGYDERGRILEVETGDGRVLQFTGVGSETYRRLISSPSPASYFKDHIEEEFPSKRLR